MLQRNTFQQTDQRLVVMTAFREEFQSFR